MTRVVTMGSGLLPLPRRGTEAQAEHGKLVPETEKYASRLMIVSWKAGDGGCRARQASTRTGWRNSRCGIRYTFLFEPEDYIVGVRELTGVGGKVFELGVVKNTLE